MNLIHKLRCAIDEPYRIRHGFGLSVLRSNRELRALIDFCRSTLKEYREAKFTSSFMKTWAKTIKLYEDMEDCSDLSDKFLAELELERYIDNHFKEYWS